MQVIFGDQELRLQPYEWVYDGLKPLFLDSVFDIKKGIHISLSAVYCAVGRRLECPILPELASRAGEPLRLNITSPQDSLELGHQGIYGQCAASTLLYHLQGKHPLSLFP